MEQILIIREALVKFFKRYESFILPVLQFILGYFVFSSILSVGHVHAAIEPFTEDFSSGVLALFLALFFTVMPRNMGWILLILVTTIQFSVSIEIAIAVFVFLLFIFIFYARLATKESVLILLTIIAFHFNVPYLIPLIVGLYFPITAIIPITIGIFVNAQISTIMGIMQHTGATATAIGADMEIADLFTELPEAFTAVYETLMHSITVTNTWLFTAIVFAVVILLVRFVSKMPIDFSKEIAIALGCVANIGGFVLVMLMWEAGNNSIGIVIVLTLICGILAWLIRCFDSILDYQRAESVQFEDDHNYYHVRIVPKVILTKSKRVVKRIRPADALDGSGTYDTSRMPRPAGGGADGRPVPASRDTGRMPRPEGRGDSRSVSRDTGRMPRQAERQLERQPERRSAPRDTGRDTGRMPRQPDQRPRQAMPPVQHPGEETARRPMPPLQRRQVPPQNRDVPVRQDSPVRQQPPRPRPQQQPPPQQYNDR